MATARAPLSYGMAPLPRTAPQVPPYQAPSPFGYTPPTPGRFDRPAPTATPYGGFTAPDPSQIGTDPYFQFRLSQGLKGLERGAASRGTLLSGGLQNRLQEYGQEMASAEGDKIYGRALSAYGTNRDTHNQNFGQEMSSYQGNLASFNANLAATGLEGSQGLNAATAGYDRNAAAGRMAWEDERDNAFRQTDVNNANQQTAYQSQLDDYARMVEAARQQNEAQAAAARRPMAPLPGIGRRRPAVPR